MTCCDDPARESRSRPSTRWGRGQPVRGGRPPHWLTLLSQAVLVAVVIATVTLALGPGTNILTLVAFLVSAIIVMFGGVYVGVWLLVGAVYRRFNN